MTNTPNLATWFRQLYCQSYYDCKARSDRGLSQSGRLLLLLTAQEMNTSEILHAALVRQNKIIDSIEEDQRRGIDGYINIMRNASLRGLLSFGNIDSECDDTTTTEGAISKISYEQTPICLSHPPSVGQRDVTVLDRADFQHDTVSAANFHHLCRDESQHPRDTGIGAHSVDTRQESPRSDSLFLATAQIEPADRLSAKRMSDDTQKRTPSFCEETRDRTETRTRTILFLPHDFDPPQGCLLGSTWLPSHMIFNYTHEQAPNDCSNSSSDRSMNIEPLRFCHIFVPARKMHKAFKRQIVERFILEDPRDNY